MDTSKKISFGFSKLSKKPANINKPQEKQVDFVDCLEGQSIKLINETPVVEKQPLVIPLRDNKKDLLDRVRDMKAKQKKKEEADAEDNRPDSELTENELAAREVIREAKLRLAEKDTTNNKIFVLPLKKEDELPLEGEKEPTLSDYENVPVSDFGMALLRGMGWKEGVGIGKNPSKSAELKAPELRPKGLGLGASVIAKSEKDTTNAYDESLIIKRGSYAKIVNGIRKGQYCEVQGLDDEAGRVIVKTTLKSEVLALNEFMLVPVSKEDYSRNSKVINNAKFEEYKEMEQRKIKTEVKQEKDDNETNSYQKTIRNMKSEKKDHHTSDDSDSHSRKSKQKEKSSRNSRKYSDESSESDSEYERSRKTHRRKDKRRHRDKSRSPYKSSKKSSKSKHRYSSSGSDSDREHKHRNRHRNDSDSDRHRRRNKR